MKRIIHTLFAFVLLIWLCVSAHFLALEADHDCHDEKECPVCACIQICNEIQKNMTNVLACAIIVMFAALITYTPLFCEHIETADTLVTKKIRLND